MFLDGVDNDDTVEHGGVEFLGFFRKDIGLGDYDNLVLVEGLDNVFNRTSGQHDVGELHSSSLLEGLFNRLDSIGHLLGNLLGLLGSLDIVEHGFEFGLGEAEGKGLLLAVLPDGLDGTEVIANFGASGNKGDGGLLVILDDLIVVLETLVDEGESRLVSTAVDTEIFNVLGGGRIGGRIGGRRAGAG